MCVCLISYWVWEKKNNINWIYIIIMYMVNSFHTCLYCFCDCHTTCLPEKLASDLWCCPWSSFKLFQVSYEFFIEFDFFLLPLYLSVIRFIFLKKIKLQFTMVISFKCGLLKGENYYFSLWQRLLICNWESIGIRFLLPWALQYEKSVWNLVDFPCVSIKLNWIQIWDSIIISSPPLYTKCRLLSASRIFNLMNNLCPTWTSGRVSEGNFSVLEPNNLHILGVGHTRSIGTSLIPQWPWNGYTTL